VHTRRGSDLLAQSLRELGVDTVFGVAGDTGVSFYDALSRHSPEIRHVLANDERGAAFMADVYARRGNRLGVVEVSSGGGATFVVGGLGEPYAASVPLLVISTDIHTGSRGTAALTEIDQEALYSAVTKWRATARSAAEIPQLVGAAATQAVSGRPGPVALIVPENILEEAGQTELRLAPPELPPARPWPAEELVGQTLELIREARQPALLVGSGIHLSGAHDALGELAERCGIPVATTIHGKGAVPDDSPWSLGSAGANGARSYARDYLSGADLVIFVGTRANSTDTDGFTAPARAGAGIVHLDIDASRAGRNYPGSLALVGDARATLERLVGGVDWTPDEHAMTERRHWIGEQRRLWLARWKQRSPSPERHVLDPWLVVRTVLAASAGDVTIVADAGTPTPYLAAGWEQREAGRRLILPRGHGPMGYALPGAVGAALADGGSVLAMVTDGSLLMACGALETATRMQLPITYVLMTNGALGWMKALQRLYFGGRYFATDISLIDGAAIAGAFGMESRRADHLDQLRDGVRSGLTGSRPSLIEVRIPGEHELLPPVSAWQRAVDDPGATRPVY
jgi:acetolactate synthase-1/2/3 large subunit